MLLSLVEQESESYASHLKTVLESGKESEVVEGLKKLIEERQGDIQQICTTFYQDFFGSVDELASVRAGVDRVRTQLMDLASEARRSSSDFAAQARKLQDSWTTAENSVRAKSAVSQTLQLCFLMDQLRMILQGPQQPSTSGSGQSPTKPQQPQPADSANPASATVGGGDLCRALKLIERIRTTYLTALGHMQMVQHIAAQIPVLENTIQEQATAQYKEWLSAVWGMCSVLGRAEAMESERALAWRRGLVSKAFRESVAFGEKTKRLLLPIDALSSQTAKSLSQIDHSKRVPPLGSSDSSGSADAAIPSLAAASDGSSSYYPTGDVESMLPDFAPLYQAVYVFRKLGKLTEFGEDYAETKKLQVMKIFQAQPDSVAASSFKEAPCVQLLHTLAGFFAVESLVAHTTHGFLPPSAVEDLVRVAFNKLKAVVQNNFAIVRTTAAFRSIAEAVVLFSETMKRHRYDVTPLMDFLPESSQRYAEVAFETFSTAIDAAFRKNTWEPLVVTNPEALESRVLANGLAVPMPDAGLPQKMHFSPVVPEFCTLLKSTISEFFVAAEHLGDVERLVTKTADQCIQRFVRLLAQRPPKDQVLMASQLLADLHSLTGVPAHFEAFIARRCAWGHVPSLELSKKMIEGAQTESENAIQTSFQAKFDLLLGPWMSDLVSAAPGPQGYHQFVEDVKAFVRQVNSTLSGVPVSVPQSIVSQSLRRVAETLINVLLSDHNKRVYYSALLALQTDCTKLEEFAGTLGIDEASPLNPVKPFTRVRQVLLVLAKPDAETIFDAANKPGAHPVLADPHTLAAILDKIKEDKLTPPTFSKSAKAAVKMLNKQQPKK